MAWDLQLILQNEDNNIINHKEVLYKSAYFLNPLKEKDKLSLKLAEIAYSFFNI